VSKDRLDVAVGSTGAVRGFDNDAAGHVALARHLRTVAPARRHPVPSDPRVQVDVGLILPHRRRAGSL